MMEDEVISAFAYKVGRELEKLAEERNGNLRLLMEKLEIQLIQIKINIHQ